MTQLALSRVDLHCHSTASDGLYTPDALVRYAADRGVRTIALTDHDTTAGIRSASTAGAVSNVTVVPGVELSSEIDGLQAHILGYFIDPDSESLQAEFRWMNESRRDRIERICRNLQRAGLPISSDEVFELAGDSTVGRPHVARVLVRHGYASDVSDAFRHYLVRGTPGYATSEKITPEGAIRAIRQAGGVAVLAHPWSTRNPEAAVARLVDDGLTGVECYYAEYQQSVQGDLAALAANHGLVATGGSDFHGPGVKAADLGSVLVPPAAVDRLRLAAEAARVAS